VLDTNTVPSSIANCGLTFVFDIRHPNWYIATKIQALRASMSIELAFRNFEVILEFCPRVEIEALLAQDQR
jgi:hypothetical protein